MVYEKKHIKADLIRDIMNKVVLKSKGYSWKEMAIHEDVLRAFAAMTTMASALFAAGLGVLVSAVFFAIFSAAGWLPCLLTLVAGIWLMIEGGGMIGDLRADAVIERLDSNFVESKAANE